MSIASQITRINGNIAAAYSACSDKGATMPQTQNSANLSDTIDNIPNAFDSYIQGDLTEIVSAATKIRDSCFRYQLTLTKASFPNATEIGENAFAQSGLTGFTVPNSVTKIKGGAFRNCDYFTILDMSEYTDPTALPTIENNTFSGTKTNTGFQILVSNQACLDALSTMTNWSAMASTMIIKTV